MKSYRDIRTDNYSYNLPEERIAKYPLEKRDDSKLLVYRKGNICDDVFRNLSSHIESDRTLIFNETEVIRSRLIFRKPTGALIEIFCLEPENPSDYEQSLSSSDPVEWKCIVGNLKKWKDGHLEMLISLDHKEIVVKAERISRDGNNVLVRFTWDDSRVCFSEILEAQGHMPVPPYLKRDDEEIDNLRYQTVYSSHKGSVAAPTAGLHFTPETLKGLGDKGIKSGKLTLHVGAGTFIPVKSETIGGHTMHREHFMVSRKTVELLLKENIIAVGTTSVRTVESIYQLGNKLLKGYTPYGEELVFDQWEAYDKNGSISREESLSALLGYMDSFNLDSISASTSIIIVPGYKFGIVEGLITNYHMPSSTLLLLVAALIGDKWKKVYRHALDNNYRFLSYGDSSLLLP
jgi:S-adenosylmethionine:tRNA ribosyltransferase-isomerase